MHGHGYRFVGELQGAALPEQPASAGDATQPTTELPARRAPKRRLAVVGAAVATALIVGLGWSLFRPPSLNAADVRIAVLPVEDRTGEAELDWVSLGMMSLMSRMLEDKGFDVLSDRRVLKLAQESDEAGSDSILQALREAYGVTHTLESQIERAGGLLQLTYRLRGESGDVVERTTVSKESGRLAADASQNIAGLVEAGSMVARPARAVSQDPFVNEAYGRGLALQLEGDITAARGYFQVAIQSDPELFWPRYEFALTERNLNHWEAAESALTSLLEEAKELPGIDDDIAAGNALGILYYERSRLDEAQTVLESALTLAESNEDFGNAANRAGQSRDVGASQRGPEAGANSLRSSPSPLMRTTAAPDCRERCRTILPEST